jgi:ATP:ADP antiporter, AAA family
MTTVAVPAPAEPRGVLDRLLSLFTDVRAGEGATAALLMLDAFLLLGAYYLLKPLREGLILSEAHGAEIKSYAAAGMAVLLMVCVPAYSALAHRMNRSRLISWVTLFFVSNLLVFFVLLRAGVPHLGVAYFLWIGIFNLAVVAQFWAFANDVYDPDQGRRLFGVVGFGSSMGAIAGAWAAKPLIDHAGTQVPMLIAAAVLVMTILLTRLVHVRERVAHDVGGRPVNEDARLTARGGFRLVMTDRYLLLLAALVLVYNWVNTNGEYILGRTVKAYVESHVAQDQVEKGIDLFYAGFYTWVNWIGVAIQLLLVSRILKRFGPRVGLFVLPVIALGGYGMIAAAALTPALLGLIRKVKIAENATDYSLYTTTRQALFLPTSRDAKYKAKMAIDTFFVRFGDVLSAGLVLLGTALAVSARGIAVVNVALIVVWLLLAAAVAVRYHRLEHARAESQSPAPGRGSPLTRERA